MAETSTTLLRIDSDSLDEVNDFFYRQGMTDGLPIIPPTPERVAALVHASGRGAEDVIGPIPPSTTPATVEKLAANAVMAGCRPEHMPLLLAAIEAILDERFNLYGMQATTNPAHPGFVTNGPVAQEADVNSGYGCLGPGTRANVAIGRAVRLVLLNAGGAAPGLLDRATQGQPGKLGFLFAENEKASPWEPLHVERGYQPVDSTVTAFGAGGVTNILDNTSKRGEELLTTIAHSMMAIGTNNMSIASWPVVILSPEHAQTIAAAGFKKRDVKQFLFENARVPLDLFPTELRQMIVEKRSGDAGFWGSHLSPARSPDAMLVLVAGGDGKHSTFVQTALAKEPVTRLVKNSG